jgi:hypothetical protein
VKQPPLEKSLNEAPSSTRGRRTRGTFIFHEIRFDPTAVPTKRRVMMKREDIIFTRAISPTERFEPEFLNLKSYFRKLRELRSSNKKVTK